MMRTFTSETLALHAARYSDVSQDRFFRQGEYAEQQNARIAPLKAVAPTMRSTTPLQAWASFVALRRPLRTPPQPQRRGRPDAQNILQVHQKAYLSVLRCVFSVSECNESMRIEWRGACEVHVHVVPYEWSQASCSPRSCFSESFWGKLYSM
jgi:hypothetical protein